MAQQYKAFAKQMNEEEAVAAARQKLQEQEDISLEQVHIFYSFFKWLLRKLDAKDILK